MGSSVAGSNVTKPVPAPKKPSLLATKKPQPNPENEVVNEKVLKPSEILKARLKSKPRSSSVNSRQPLSSNINTRPVTTSNVNRPPSASNVSTRPPTNVNSRPTTASNVNKPPTNQHQGVVHEKSFVVRRSAPGDNSRQNKSRDPSPWNPSTNVKKQERKSSNHVNSGANRNPP